MRQDFDPQNTYNIYIVISLLQNGFDLNRITMPRLGAGLLDEEEDSDREDMPLDPSDPLSSILSILSSHDEK